MRPISKLPAALAVIPLLASTSYAQQQDYTDPAVREAGYSNHLALEAASPFGEVPWQFIGPTNVSGRITDIAAATPRGKSYTIFVATASGGVWRTDDDGESFRPAFEHGGSTSIGDVTIAPSNNDIVWIGTGESNIFRSSMAGYGVYKSTDGGETWEHKGLIGTNTIARIVIHPTNPDIVYVAAGGHEWTNNPERGLYKSIDGGDNWEQVLYVSEETGVYDLVMHPTDPDILYASTWQRVRKRWNDPRNEDGDGESSIRKTTDGGATWTEVTNGLPEARWRGRIGIDLCRSQPDTLYAFIDNYSIVPGSGGGRDAYGRPVDGRIEGAQIWRTDDAGQNWRMTSLSNQQMRGHSGTYGWVFGQVRVDPNDPETVYTMGLGLNVSHDGGRTVQRAGGVGGDHHALWIDPDNSSYLLNGCDQGFGISYDMGQTWKRTTDQIPVVQFFNLNYDMAEPFNVFGSIQDHGSRKGVVDIRPNTVVNTAARRGGRGGRGRGRGGRGRRGGARSVAGAFQGAPGGEGSSHFIDPRNENIVYSAGFYGSISRTDIGPGGTGTRIAPQAGPDEPPLRGQWVAPFILSPHNPDVLLYGNQHLYRSTDRGDTMVKISPDLTYNNLDEIGDIPFQTIFTISESAVKEGLIYAGTDDGRLHVTKSTGQEWTDITAGLAPRRWMSRVQASRFDEATVYLSQNGKRHDDFTPYLWKSENYGQSWQNIAGNIPLGPINVVREDPRDKDILYVGTDLSVYITIDGGSSWHSLAKDLPTTFVSDLIIHPRDDIVVISTHGRGMYALDATVLRQRITELR